MDDAAESTLPFTQPEHEHAVRKLQIASRQNDESWTLSNIGSNTQDKQEPFDATQLYYMKEAFQYAVKSQVPEARLILSHASSPQGIRPARFSEAIKLSFVIDSWEMLGIVQRHT